MLILASTSPYRKTLLTRLGVEFQISGSDYDERQHDHLFFEDGPWDCAHVIAYNKARTVLQRKLAEESPSLTSQVKEDLWVLGADQIVWMRTSSGTPIQFHKPGTTEAALHQLMWMRGQKIYSTTGITLMSPLRTLSITPTEEMTFREYSEDEARTYVEKYKPLDCAGSFRIEEAGLTLLSQIQGDWTGCQGLPLLAVANMFRIAGLLPS